VCATSGSSPCTRSVSTASHSSSSHVVAPPDPAGQLLGAWHPGRPLLWGADGAATAGTHLGIPGPRPASRIRSHPPSAQRLA
jgi:hypothetical protein